MRGLRLFALVFFFVVMGAALMSRLLILQIKKGEFYKALAEGEQNKLISKTGRRGEIFMKGSQPLAINKTEWLIFISPKEIKKKQETAQKLAEITGKKKKEILKKTKKPNYFEIVKKDISEKEKSQIRESNLTGVYVDKEQKRFYPQKKTAAFVTGFVGGEGKGQYGVEGFYDPVLTGKSRLTQKERGAFGLLERTSSKSSGDDIHLTIEPGLQYAAHQLLSENKKELGFRNGQIIIMDPTNGEIKALAQVPSFNPNKYFQTADLSLFRNRLIHALYEPGSVFKPITMAASINEGRIEPDTTYVDKGVLEIGDDLVHNYDNRVWGEQNMTAVLEKSINTGAVFAEKKLGHHLFLDYLEKFGLFEKTGVDLQGEVFSENREFKKGYQINFATASFGQGISVTPIQLLRAFTAIANQGEMITPHLLKKEGQAEKKTSKVISEETAKTVTRMLLSVVENGYAKGAQVEGYQIAGKTGTAQIPWSSLGVNKKGYSEQTAQTFIGFAPAFDPRFIILVKLDNPGAKTAEYSAVPLFQKMAKKIINLWEIPPTGSPQKSR